MIQNDENCLYSLRSHCGKFELLINSLNLYRLGTITVTVFISINILGQRRTTFASSTRSQTSMYKDDGSTSSAGMCHGMVNFSPLTHSMIISTTKISYKFNTQGRKWNKTLKIKAAINRYSFGSR